jgi:hypothetical protein
MDVETVQPIVRPQLPPRGTFERVPPTTTG